MEAAKLPLQKFRSLKEAEQALWCDHPDDAYLDRLERWWSIVDQLSPRSYPPGVRKYRSLEEADRDRQKWLQRQSSHQGD